MGRNADDAAVIVNGVRKIHSPYLPRLATHSRPTSLLLRTHAPSSRPIRPSLLREQLEKLSEKWTALSAEMERQLQEARRGEREAVRAFVEAKAERDRFAGEEERNRAVWFRAATSDRLGGTDADPDHVSAVAASEIAEIERLAEERMAELEALCAAKVSAADDAAAQRIAEMEVATAEALKHVEGLAAVRIASQAQQARSRPAPSPQRPPAHIASPRVVSLSAPSDPPHLLLVPCVPAGGCCGGGRRRPCPKAGRGRGRAVRAGQGQGELLRRRKRPSRLLPFSADSRTYRAHALASPESSHQRVNASPPTPATLCASVIFRRRTSCPG